MKFFEIRNSNERLITPTGLAAVGALAGLTDLSKRVDLINKGKEYTYQNSDCIVAYLGILSQGKSDFEDIREMHDDPAYFAQALGIRKVTSPETLRQRMNELSMHMIGVGVVLQENARLLKRAGVKPTACFTGHIPMDIDVSCHDNSKTKKEGVSRTYKGFDGFAPSYCYLGTEGYLVNVELREGDAHCQCGTDEFLKESIELSKKVTKAPLLVRMDSGNDSIDNIEVCIESGADFIIKRNLRNESKEAWLNEMNLSVIAEEDVEIEAPREGKNVYRGSVYRTRKGKNGTYRVRVAYEITERTSLSNGQILLQPELEVDTYWTSLESTEADVVKLYHEHAVCEQFHSEIKTDMELERFPSSRFDTNAIVLQLAAMAYNILRIMGQTALMYGFMKSKKGVKRLRVKTVIQDLIQIAGHVVSHARKEYINLGRSNVWRNVFAEIYRCFVSKYKAVQA